MDLSKHEDEAVFRLAANCIVEIETGGPRQDVARVRLVATYKDIERRLWGRDGTGMLHALGYHVGRTDPVPFDRRKAILGFAFSQPLPQIRSAVYMDSWGEPGSSRRKARLLKQLTSFYDNNVWRPEMNRACIEWKADIDFVGELVVGTAVDFIASPCKRRDEVTETPTGPALDGQEAVETVIRRQDRGEISRFRKTIEWRRDDQQFKLTQVDLNIELSISDGQVLTLHSRDWQEVITALCELLTSESGTVRHKPHPTNTA